MDSRAVGPDDAAARYGPGTPDAIAVAQGDGERITKDSNRGCDRLIESAAKIFPQKAQAFVALVATVVFLVNAIVTPSESVLSVNTVLVVFCLAFAGFGAAYFVLTPLPSQMNLIAPGYQQPATAYEVRLLGMFLIVLAVMGFGFVAHGTDDGRLWAFKTFAGAMAAFGVMGPFVAWWTKVDHVYVGWRRWLESMEPLVPVVCVVLAGLQALAL